jgi:hypothetical protein
MLALHFQLSCSHLTYFVSFDLVQLASVLMSMSDDYSYYYCLMSNHRWYLVPEIIIVMVNCCAKFRSLSIEDSPV